MTEVYLSCWQPQKRQSGINTSLIITKENDLNGFYGVSSVARKIDA